MRKLFMRPQAKKLNNKGLTLVEVMVSITVFGLMVSPILTQFNSILKQNYTVKLSQAETDYATRVMEEFKSQNSDATKINVSPDYDTDNENLEVDEDGWITDNFDGSVSAMTLGGYKVEKDEENDEIKLYSKDGIRIEEDLDPTEKSLVKSGTTYEVKVTADPTFYDAEAGEEEEDTDDEDLSVVKYKNPNASDKYTLENIDRRFAVIVSDGSANYDNRAANDLLDKMAKILRSDPDKGKRYNLWLSGVDVFNRVEYDKNTYIRIRYDAGKEKYYATVVLNYSTNSDPDIETSVSYTLVNEQEFDAKALNYRAPSVYVFYNQFVQNNLVVNNSVRESITIDNSGLKDSDGKIPAAASPSKGNVNNSVDCYVIRSNTETDGTYTYYKRTAESEKIGAKETENTQGSIVYSVSVGGEQYYQWPSYIIDAKDVIVDPAVDTGLITREELFAQFGESTVNENNTSENEEDTVTTQFYRYDNVLVPASFPHADPSAVGGYVMEEGRGNYSYVCKTPIDMAGLKTSVHLEEGDVIYQRPIEGKVGQNEYVLPNGDVARQMPGRHKTTAKDKEGNVKLDEDGNPITKYESWEDYFSLCRPSKLDYESSAKLNVVVTKDSRLNNKKGGKAIKVYTNLITPDPENPSKYLNYLTSNPAAVYTKMTAPVNGLDTEVTLNCDSVEYLYPHDDPDTPDKIAYPLTAKKDDNGLNKLYHIKLELFRRDIGSNKLKRVLVLESGKEG